MSGAWLSDAAIARLRLAAELPELGSSRYEVRALLGRGGMGSVYLAHDTGLGRDVAIKVLHDPAPGSALLARLQREARLLARLEHPGIVPIHDLLHLPDGRVAYVMQHVQGARLDQHLAGERGLEARLRVFLKLCESVAFAHDRGVVHRDLKPENVMLGRFGEVLVLDFGVAHAAGEPLERAGTVVGTERYMAPEQARGEVERIDARSDVHALGRILAGMLAGAEPPANRPLRAIAAKASADDPAARYPSAAALRSDLEAFLSGRPVSALPETPLDRLARLYRRHRVAVWLVAAYLAMRGAVLLTTGR